MKPDINTIFQNKLGKLFPQHIIFIGYFILIFLPLVWFGVVKVEINTVISIIGLLISAIFVFSTHGVIIDFNNGTYKFYDCFLFMKIGQWRSVKKISKVVFTKGNVGNTINYGRHVDVDLAYKINGVYLLIENEKKLIFSGKKDEGLKIAENIANTLGLPLINTA